MTNDVRMSKSPQPRHDCPKADCNLGYSQKATVSSHMNPLEPFKLLLGYGEHYISDLKETFIEK